MQEDGRGMSGIPTRLCPRILKVLLDKQNILGLLFWWSLSPDCLTIRLQFSEDWWNILYIILFIPCICIIPPIIIHKLPFSVHPVYLSSLQYMDNHAILAWLPIYRNQPSQTPQKWGQYSIFKTEARLSDHLFSLGMRCRFESSRS